MFWWVEFSFHFYARFDGFLTQVLFSLSTKIVHKYWTIRSVRLYTVHYDGATGKPKISKLPKWNDSERSYRKNLFFGESFLTRQLSFYNFFFPSFPFPNFESFMLT